MKSGFYSVDAGSVRVYIAGIWFSKQQCCEEVAGGRGESEIFKEAETQKYILAIFISSHLNIIV